MTSADIERVDEARARLRELLAGRIDSAVRISRLDAPVAGEPPLVLNRRFTVIAGLGEEAKHALGRTVDSLYGTVPAREALSGTARIDGDLRPLHDPHGDADAQRAGPEAIFGDHFDVIGANSIAWADPDDLRAVVAALETAIALTSAELRGADLVARELRGVTTEPDEVIDLVATDERADLDAAIAALEETEAHPELFDELRVLLDEIAATRQAGNPAAVVEQYTAALDRLLPTDSAHTRRLLQSALDTARAELDAHRHRQTDATGRIVAVLDALGVDADADTAIARAERVLIEREEIGRLRRRLAGQRDEAGGGPAAAPERPEPGVDPELERRRSQLRRRLQSQQRLLAATREQLAFATRDGAAWSELPGRTVTPTNGEGRPLPILVEDPTVDLPSRHGASALSVLLRLSELTQVICISDDPDLARWAHDIGSRVGFVRAVGWFADEGRPC